MSDIFNDKLINFLLPLSWTFLLTRTINTSNIQYFSNMKSEICIMILQFQNPILVSILNREKYQALVSLNPFEKRLIKCVELNKHEVRASFPLLLPAR